MSKYKINPITGKLDFIGAFTSTGDVIAITEEQQNVLEHFRYDEPSRKLIADRAIETTLNSLFLGQQHKMS